MTFTEHLDAIAEKLGVDYLPDRLLTTYLEAFAKNQGVDVSSLQDKLVTTYLAAILNARGGNSVSDNLVTTYLAEIAKTYGVDELVDNMIATYLKEIADAIEGGDEITHKVYFHDETGAKLLHTAVVKDGGSGVYGGTIPTKESTAQYTYTFANAWSLTPGGTADSDALKNVTADRNVYAVFNEVVRTYTVYWYNGSNLLETDTDVPYGSIPTYDGSTPVDEDGGKWSGWQPEVAPVTGDVSYVATFDEPGGDEPAEMLSWEGVAYHIDNGTYKDVYSVGDAIPLDLGSEGVINMQVAAFDTDDLADGSGKAPMTFIAKELLETSKRMNPARAGTSGAYTEGTGAIGGWEKCEMRTYLNDTVKPMIPDNAAALIKAVTKTQTAYDTTGTSFTQTTEDKVWIPAETDALWNNVLATGADRVKTKVSKPTSSYTWWTRKADGSSGYRNVSYNAGTVGYSNAKDVAAICLCFCVGKTPV